MPATKRKPAKSCGPQLSELPSTDWEEERLKTHATELCQRIDEVERPLAQEYWLLGASLEALKAKRKFRRGEFSKYLKELDVEKTRASKARAIKRAFTKPADLEGLTVEAAYQKRQRKIKQRDSNKRPRKPDAKRTKEFEAVTGPSVWVPLPDFLRDAALQAERCLTEAKKAPPANARAMAEEIAATIKKLQELQKTLAAVEDGDNGR